MTQGQPLRSNCDVSFKGISMYTISKLAKLSGLSEKAIRLYEENGLLTKAVRSEGNYRHFNNSHLKELKRIISLKSLGLTLKDIKGIIRNLEDNAEEAMNDFYIKQLKKTEIELKLLEKRKNEINKKISITQRLTGVKNKGVGMKKDLNDFLNLKKVALAKYSKYGDDVTSFLEREKFFDSEVKIQFLEDVQEVLKFLEKTKIKIGPLRGPSSSSLVLDLLGLNSINPLDYGLIPERFNKENLYLDFNVEFVRGDEFIWFCKELTHDRPYKFEAYKFPIIDIIDSTERKIKKKINPNKLADFDENFKKLLTNDDFHFISGVHFPENTQCFKIFESQSILWDTQKNLKLLNPQNVYDIWGYIALEGRKPAEKKFNDFILNKKHEDFESFPTIVQSIMSKNRGHLVYQEEWLTILAHFLNNDFTLAEHIRQDFRKNGGVVFQRYQIPEKIKSLLISEHDSLFNFSHIVSVWQHAKVCAYLKSHHREVYLKEIEEFELKNPQYSWADFGFKSDGLILMQ